MPVFFFATFLSLLWPALTQQQHTPQENPWASTYPLYKEKLCPQSTVGHVSHHLCNGPDQEIGDLDKCVTFSYNAVNMASRTVLPQQAKYDMI